MDLQFTRRPVEVTFSKHGLGILESHHEKDFHMHWRRDSFPKILLFVGGEGMLNIGKREFAFQAPCLCILPAGLRHRTADRPGSPLSLYGLCFRNTQVPSPDFVRLACRTVGLVTSPSVVSQGERIFRELLALKRESAPHRGDLEAALACQLLLLLTRSTSSLSSAIPRSDARVRSYIAGMEQEFWKPTSLNQAALSVGLSRRRFSELFREQCGESWEKRLSALRVGHAMKLLANTSLPVRAVAFECGYGDFSHFYRAFKNVTGRPPGAWRKHMTV